jgi:hypothetical protein|tara:strand:- start:549 stop:884 length:336 start_codon:yes stop_codon:yes gene_type:complete
MTQAGAGTGPTWADIILKQVETDMKLTHNQSAAMHWLIKSCCANMGGKNLADLQCDPFTWVDVDDLIDAGWSRKEAEGTFGSLVASGHIWDADDGLFALTDDWDELRKFHE